MSAEQSQLPAGVPGTSPAWYARRTKVPVPARKSLFGKEELVSLKSVRRVCAVLAALAATLGASLPAVAEPAETTAQAVQLRTIRAPRELTAMVEGPTRIALSWQEPKAAGMPVITGYGIQFSDDGGAHWSVLPSVGRRTTSFVHTVGLRANAEFLYRVFSLSGEGAGPAALVSAATPAIAMPRIVGVSVGIDQGVTRWYTPRRDIVVTVQFDQAVIVNTKYGAPQIDLEMGHPPHRQSGYASDYSGGSGTDQLTFRYSAADWHRDLSDIEVGPDALHRNGARITNVAATHSASLAHGAASVDSGPRVDTRSDAILVKMDSPAAAPVPAAPRPDRQFARDQQSGSSPGFAAMLTAAGALVAGAEIAHQLVSTEGTQTAAPASPMPSSARAAIAVELGDEVGPRAFTTVASDPPEQAGIGVYAAGPTKIVLEWWDGNYDEDGPTAEEFLLEVSDDAGLTWENLLGTDGNGDDLYREASEAQKYEHTGLVVGTTRHYRVTARNSAGSGEESATRSATTQQITAVAGCGDALWSTSISVGRHGLNDYRGFTRVGTTGFGWIVDNEFTLDGTTYTVQQAYFDEPGRYAEREYGWLPKYHFATTPGIPSDRWDHLTVFIGQKELSMAEISAHAQQSGWYGYNWQSSDYRGTFEYRNNSLVRVCLVDSSPGVTLALTPDSISENGGSTTVTASVEHASSTAFTVTVSAEPDSPAVDGDFTLSTNKILSFAADATESTGTVTITANDNDVDTPDKTITVQGDLSSGAVLRAPEDVTLTITDDDDAPELGLSVSPATIAEDGGVASVTVSTTGTSTFADNQTISLTFTGTATKGTDYTVSTESLTLEAGERSVASSVTATDDSADESDETVLVSATHDGSTVGTQQQITIADTLAAALSAHSLTVNEGGDATFEVNLSGGTSTADVEVSYAVDTSSTATAGTDYTAPSGKLTITAGESSGTITIATLTDQVLDPDETLVVKLTSATTDTRTVTADATATKTATIKDTGMAKVSVGPVLVEDDDQTPEDESDDKSSVEEGETASFVVTLDGAVSGTVSVTYTTADGTAESGTGKDYTTASGTLQFTTGQTSKTIEVTTLEDTLNEAAETYTLTLTGVSGVDGVSLGTDSAPRERLRMTTR